MGHLGTDELKWTMDKCLIFWDTKNDIYVICMFDLYVWLYPQQMLLGKLFAYMGQGLYIPREPFENPELEFEPPTFFLTGPISP